MSPLRTSPQRTATPERLQAHLVGSPNDSIAISTVQAHEPRHTWAATTCLPSRTDEMLVKVAEALVHTSNTTALDLLACRLTRTFSCRASNNCERSEHPSSPVCCNVR